MVGSIHTRHEAATPIPRSRAGRRPDGWRVVVTPALLLACGLPAMAASPLPAGTGAQAQGGGAAGTRTVVDHAVVPAGGARCPHCPPGKCRHGQGHQRSGGHHPQCRHGQCVPYCPVRPAEFGFYGTRWRRWPGQGVMPVSAEQAATPIVPPRSEIPGPDEESPRRPDEEPAASGADEAADPDAGPASAAGVPRPSAAPQPPEPPELPDESAPGDG